MYKSSFIKCGVTAAARRVLILFTFVTLFACFACGNSDNEETETSASSGSVIINEVSCHGRDWVEIVNITESDVSIGSWYVSDSTMKEDHLYQLPATAVMQSGERLVIKQEKDTEEGFSFGFRCGDETAYLLDDELALVDQVEIGNVTYGNTWGLLPDITGIWCETSPTDGEVNTASSIASE
jgi:hypothetical protein